MVCNLHALNVLHKCDILTIHCNDQGMPENLFDATIAEERGEDRNHLATLILQYQIICFNKEIDAAGKCTLIVFVFKTVSRRVYIRMHIE